MCACKDDTYFWALGARTKTERIINIQTKPFHYFLDNRERGRYRRPTGWEPGFERPDLPR